jgi:hypothetical protein
MANQYTDDNKGLGEGATVIPVKVTAAQLRQLKRDVKAAGLPWSGGRSVYIRRRLGLEAVDVDTAEAGKAGRAKPSPRNPEDGIPPGGRP